MHNRLTRRAFLVEVDSVPECGKLAAGLIADAAGRHEVWRRAGFASQTGCQNPGEHSLKLGTPGLYDGRPLAFKTRMSVYRASLSRSALGTLNDGLRKKDGLHLANAVSSMQACAVHLCHRSPRRWRVG